MSVYISAFSTDSTTVSAPPSVLRSLLAFSKSIADSSKQELPIAAAFHGSHLQKPNYGKIVGSSTVLNLPLTRSLELIMTSSSVSFDGTHFRNLRELLMKGLEDIFQSPICWSKSVEGIFKRHALRHGNSKSEAFLTSFGPNALVKSFLKIALMEGVEVTSTKPVSFETDETDANLRFRSGSGDIAIIGMAGRFPGANDLKEFWEILKDARDLHKEIPKDRFDVNAYFDLTGSKPNTTISRFGNFIEEPGLFDARLFRMSPREAKQTGKRSSFSCLIFKGKPFSSEKFLEL